jgi:hypothetical protein
MSRTILNSNCVKLYGGLLLNSQILGLLNRYTFSKYMIQFKCKEVLGVKRRRYIYAVRNNL